MLLFMTNSRKRSSHTQQWTEANRFEYNYCGHKVQFIRQMFFVFAGVCVCERETYQQGQSHESN